MTICAACAPPGGGRNPVTPRLLRHFSMLTIPAPSEISLKQMFTVSENNLGILRISRIDNGSSRLIINKTYVNSIWLMTFGGLYKYFQLNSDMVCSRTNNLFNIFG